MSVSNSRSDNNKQMYTNRGFMQREYLNSNKYPNTQRLITLNPSPRNRYSEVPKSKILNPYPNPQPTSFSPIPTYKKSQRRSNNIDNISPMTFISSLEGRKMTIKESADDKQNSAFTTSLNLTKSVPQLSSLASPRGEVKNYSRNMNTISTEELSIRKSGFTIDGVFEIYGVGYSYSTRTGYGHPLGMGFLITKNLIMTAHSVIPDEEVASRCFGRFSDNLYETHHFDPNRFFYTNRGLNFTVVGFTLSKDSTKPRLPIEIRESFQLKSGDNISYLNSGIVARIVTNVDEDVFSYTAGSYISPGMPIFTSD